MSETSTIDVVPEAWIIKTPEFHCQEHGRIAGVEVVSLRLGGIEDKYCLRCVRNFMRKNFSQVTRIDQ